MGALAGDRADRARRWEAELRRAPAVVEPAVGLLEDLAPEPLTLGPRDLPVQRRILWIDAGTPRLRALDIEADDQAGQRIVEPDVERIADGRRLAEGKAVLPGGADPAPCDLDVASSAAVLDD